MSPLEKTLSHWDMSVSKAKEMRNRGVKKFQILKGSLLKDAQKIYCATTFFSQ